MSADTGRLNANAMPDPMRPALYRLRQRRRELPDTVTLSLQPLNDQRVAFLPGQFTMLYAFGAGEVPISISGDPAHPERLVHTVRAVGAATRAITGLKRGATLGVRGPFGRGWPLLQARGYDVAVVAGGLGLAPLRPALYRLLAERAAYGELSLYYGARAPDDILFPRELDAWRRSGAINVALTVDRAGVDWPGRVGVVTQLLDSGFDPPNTIALLCGPEVMMRFAAAALIERGVPDKQIYLSMERNMKCAIGFCGHCQYGADFVCKDGPVYGFDEIVSRLAVREL